MLEWSNDLKLCGVELYLDSRQPRESCFVSHAHSDHLRVHDHAIATPGTRALAEYRVGTRRVTELSYHAEFAFCPETPLRLLPAGHIFGSAMLHVTRPEGTLLYTGDFKLREC